MKIKNKSNSLLIIIFLGIIIPSITISNTEVMRLGNNEQEMKIPQTSADVSMKWEHKRPAGGARVMTMSADGYYLAYVADTLIVVLNRTSNETLWSYNASETTPVAEFSADGNILALGTTNWIRLFNMTSATPSIPYWNYSIGSSTSQIKISWNGTYIFARSSTNTLYFFNNTDDSAPMWTDTHGSQIRALAMSLKGEYMYAGGNEEVLYLYNKSESGSKTPVWTYDSGARIEYIATSADGFYVIISGFKSSSHNATLLTNAENILWVYTTGLYSVTQVDISADGNYVILTTADTDRRLYLFSKLSNTPLWSYQHGTVGYYMHRAKISADGCYIVAGTDAACSVYLFAKGSSTPLLQDSSLEMTASVAISADGKYFASLDVAAPNTLTFFQNDDTSCTYDGGDGDPQDSPPDPSIPFGWYFLLISAVSIIAIVMKQKRKLI